MNVYWILNLDQSDCRNLDEMSFVSCFKTYNLENLNNNYRLNNYYIFINFFNLKSNKFFTIKYILEWLEIILRFPETLKKISKSNYNAYLYPFLSAPSIVIYLLMQCENHSRQIMISTQIIEQMVYSRKLIIYKT